ncbi:MAG: DUF3021 domain-containing protein [Oscillospiraceae bacterium]|nr:DUF3021 domain-containing protein [Oscillospiraceae bacterium]
MKRYFSEFVRRGLSACGLGPIILALCYLILQKQGALSTLTADEVCRGIFSLAALAFVAGGMNVVYKIERLPLMTAVLLHGGVLYIGYLATYLLNGWLAAGSKPLVYFTAIFVLGYIAVWAVIYCITKRDTEKLNKAFCQNRNGS